MVYGIFIMQLVKLLKKKNDVQNQNNFESKKKARQPFFVFCCCETEILLCFNFHPPSFYWPVSMANDFLGLLDSSA